MFYDLANAVDACIITGNKKHFPDGTNLTPREFFEQFEHLLAVSDTDGDS
jgi:hypothetical protein